MKLATRTIAYALTLAGLLTLIVLLPGCRRQSPVHHPATKTPSAAPTTADLVRTIDTGRMLSHIRKLADEIGPRQEGTSQERAAAEYVRARLRSYGYTATTRAVPLANGRQSLDVIAELPGKLHQAILISGHMDSHLPAPGANDDASGVAVMLELARILHGRRPPLTVIFTGFGAEEHLAGGKDRHHFGSRLMAHDPAVISRLAGMISLDMVGYGTVLHITNQGWAANRWRDRVATIAQSMGLPVRVYQGKPWSDHEAFEQQGIPVAYLHWERDPAYHRRADTPAHIQPQRLRQTAEVMLRLLLTASPNADNSPARNRTVR